MYIPAHFAVDAAAVGELLARHGAADLITQTEEGLLATMLPFAYEPAAGEPGDWGALYGHVARNNDQWHKPALGESLAIVRGPDAETFARASTAKLRPQKVDDTLAFMFESRWTIIPTRQAMEAGHRQQDYDAVWGSLTRSFRALAWKVEEPCTFPPISPPTPVRWTSCWPGTARPT